MPADGVESHKIPLLSSLMSTMVLSGRAELILLYTVQVVSVNFIKPPFKVPIHLVQVWVQQIVR
jgi:hypothetical protein